MYNVVTKNKEEVRDTVKKGVNYVYDIVGATMGANGATVIYRNDYGQPVATKDGVTVAKNLFHEDPMVDNVVQIVKQASISTATLEGDGTSSSIALAKGFVDAIDDIVEAEKEINWLMGEIEKHSQQVTTLDEVEAIASVSSNADKVITKAIRDAYELCGLDGTVQLGYEKVLGTHLKHTKGVTVQAGMVSRYFSNNAQTSEAKYTDCALLLINSDKLPPVEKFNNVVVSCGQAKLPLVIIVDTIKMDVISSVGYHAINSKIAQLCVIQTNLQGAKKETLYKDLSNAFNTPVLNDSNIDTLLPTMTPKTLGACSSFVSDMETTTLVPEKINVEYIETLKQDLEKETNVAVKEYIESRISMMTASVVTVNCGAETMAEAMELRDRLEDAIFAVKSALKGGYVAGAGNMLAHLSTKCSPNIAEALLVPQRTIYGNAGLSLVEHIEYNKGLNLRTMEVCNLCKAGIIDPTRVVKTSLKSAFSAVKTLLTTKVMFFNKLVDKQ